MLREKKSQIKAKKRVYHELEDISLAVVHETDTPSRLFEKVDMVQVCWRIKLPSDSDVTHGPKRN